MHDKDTPSRSGRSSAGDHCHRKRERERQNPFKKVAAAAAGADARVNSSSKPKGEEREAKPHDRIQKHTCPSRHESIVEAKANFSSIEDTKTASSEIDETMTMLVGWRLFDEKGGGKKESGLDSGGRTNERRTSREID